MLVCALAGLAMLGAGLEEVDGERPWRLLLLPAIVFGGVWCLHTAFAGRRHAIYQTDRPAWAVRAGLLMFGVAWPLFGLWALGIEDL